MCGRFTLVNPELLPDRFGVEGFTETRVTPRFNVAPTEEIPIIVERPEGREIRIVKWGFKPFFMRGSTSKRPPPINAKAETLLTSPMFKSSVGKWRCLIPASGFYEWREVPGEKKKQPVYIQLKNGELFGFAGLYTGGQGEEPGTAVIITTEPNELIVPVHNRMPVIVRRELEDIWLDPRMTDAEEAMTLLVPYPADEMESWPVSTKVNKAGEDREDMIEPISTTGDCDRVIPQA